MPTWDLKDMFPSGDSPEFENALLFIEEEGRHFSRKYQDRVSKLTGAQLGEAIAHYEQVSQVAGRLETYVGLTRAVDNNRSGWAETVSERIRAAEKNLLFFTLEINKMKEADLFDRIADPKLAQYGAWLRQVRSFKDHQIEDDAEDYMHQKSVVAEGAWSRLFEMTKADLRFKVAGKELTEAEILHIMHGSEDSSHRRAAHEEFGRVLGENKKTFARILNTIAGLKEMRDRLREFDNPEDSRHLSNQIEPEVVNAMVKAVRESYPKTAHRYYAWKAKKFETSRLHPADRNAALPGERVSQVSWDEAKSIVLSAFGNFSSEFKKIATNFFDKGWIDAAPRPGKASGAFSHPATPDTHPYILLNFFGTPRDVQTLAHELGHGVHQTLAARQGYLKSSTPLTLAETASVFGEMLAFREMLDREEDLVVRRTMIAGKVEDMLNTVVRQVAFFTFEQRLHVEHRRKGDLTPERISDIWQETQKESLGPSVNLDTPGSENFWMYIPHFVHSPFYVYAYAFGDCLVNALYDEYAKTPDKEVFVKKYMDLLSAGGTKRHDAALGEFGIDTADPAFWRQGLSVIERYIDELVTLDQKIELLNRKNQGFRDAGKDIVSPPSDAPGKNKINPPKGPML